ncbi:condensation domain-containing protein [Streptomyces sp. NPDC007157]|uniref:condensation domain-containing protein n=1 Tax=Streptomyces sp. NPDC007157 TaxID=3154681 RepID=UPI00340E78DC
MSANGPAYGEVQWCRLVFEISAQRHLRGKELDGTRLPLPVARYEIRLAEQLNPKGRHSRIGEYLEIRGPIDTERFEAALRRTIAEAEPFRVRFGESEGVPWRIPDLGDDWIFPVLDVSAEDDPMASAKAWMRADLARRLPLSTGPSSRTPCSGSVPNTSSGT